MLRTIVEEQVPEPRVATAMMLQSVAGLTAMDFSGYLRTKFDQARGHLRRAEEILYDLSLRDR